MPSKNQSVNIKSGVNFMKENIYKISAAQQIILLSHMIAFVLVILLGLKFLFGSIYANSFFWFIYVFLFFFSVVPTLFLHIQYYFRNRGAVLIINSDSETLSFVQANILLQHALSEIKNIEGVASYGKGTGWYSFGEYRYCKINFTDNTNIIITCLMVNDIENVLKRLLKKDIDKRFRFLAIIK